MIYSTWITKWLSRKEQLVKESTYAAYSNIVVNHLLPHFGKMSLDSITEDKIQDYVFTYCEMDVWMDLAAWANVLQRIWLLF